MTTALAPNPIFENQAAFRSVMEAFASPGEIKTLNGVVAPVPLLPVSAAILRSLADFETPIWLDAAVSTVPVVDWIRFQTGAPIIQDKQQASFALIGDAAAMPDFGGFALGTADYPDRSATIVLQVRSLREGESLALQGPGIRTQRILRADPLPRDFVERWSMNRESFPCGVDLLLVAGEEIAALPRSVRIVEGC